MTGGARRGLGAVVLAAGQGTRMKSALPKVLHPLAGRPLFFYSVRAALEAGAEQVVVVGSARPELSRALEAEFDPARVRLVVQEPPRGTGDAARLGLDALPCERLLLLCGDTPLIRAAELGRLLDRLDQDSSLELVLMSCELDAPAGYGRVLRDPSSRVLAVREDRDLRGEAERAIREVNAAVYAARAPVLRRLLAELSPDNAQGELYFTDVIETLGKSAAVAAEPGDPEALLGVNDRAGLREAEERLFERIRMRHVEAGVTVRGDARIDDAVQIAPDAVIEHGACLRGATRVGAGTRIDTGCVITDSTIGEGVNVKPYCVIIQSRVGDRGEIGPFAHMRPESVLEAGVHLGNFVETKRTHMGPGAKANHLSYLGDGDIGAGANLGAGTILCNYDGFQKHRTEIGEGAFIGSDSQIVAPVRVGKGAYVASGTTVTVDVPDDALAIGRARQENKLGRAAHLRSRLSAAAQAKKR